MNNSAYYFREAISEAVLRRYLARAVTVSCEYGELNPGNQALKRFLTHTRPKYVCRANTEWSPCKENKAGREAQKAFIDEIHKTDPDVVFEACIFECVGEPVNGIPIPRFVFEAFGLPYEERCFSPENIRFPDGRFKDQWGEGTTVPDITRIETQMLFYARACEYIDAGFEGLHMGQVELMGQNDVGHACYTKLFAMIRAYAKTHARRGFVFLNAHTHGFLGSDGTLLFDFHGYPCRPCAVVRENPVREGENVADVEFVFGARGSIYGDSKGGRTFSGWECDSLPYLVEIDNFGIDRATLGQPSKHFLWGLDEISWYSNHTAAYRHKWLRYAYDWVRRNGGYLAMPGMRVSFLYDKTAGDFVKGKYTAFAGGPFDDEEAVADIWDVYSPTDAGEVTVLNASPDTLAQVREEVRGMLRGGTEAKEIRVTLAPGIYKPEDFAFTAEDCSGKTRVTYTGPKDAVVHGGVTVQKENWLLPDEEMSSRFSPEALPHIRRISLSSFGLSRAEWGKETVVGSFHTARKYDDAPKGVCSEFFCGGIKNGETWSRRMIKARYPNAGTYAKLDAVADVGEAYEFPTFNYHADWDRLRNPRGGCYILDKETNERVRRWRDPSTAWMFGYFFWDWADSSTPITVKPETREVFPKFVSVYGARAGALYYLYNVPEELDSEGEWYLDRETGNLYFWPWEGADSADFSCCDRPLLSCSGAQNMTFSGFSLECGVVGAIRAEGKDLLFSDLAVRNIRETAAVISGNDNTVSGCALLSLGSGGVRLSGGDRKTLTHGNNRADNNLISGFAQVNQTYSPGISLEGVGNIASHNEICDTPHAAILYGGNEHLIEYNDIHDVVKMSNDAGAIYSGRDAAAHGTVIRFNRLTRVGSEEFHPEGIYWDDALSGQTAYGNLLVHVGHWGIEVGGGRENVVRNNLLVDCGGAALQYDARLREGVLEGGWFGHSQGYIDQVLGCPRDAEPWRSRYPRLAKIRTDADCPTDDPDFFCNPSYGVMRDNIAIRCARLYDVADSVPRFSDVSDNYLYESAEEAGWDEETGNLRKDSPVCSDHPAFLPIPTDKIGRNR